MSQFQNPPLNDGYKTCRCKPSCGKWLSKTARDKHYLKLSQADMEYVLDSEEEVIDSDQASGSSDE
jgi:hypothetical protein